MARRNHPTVKEVRARFGAAIDRMLARAAAERIPFDAGPQPGDVVRFGIVARHGQNLVTQVIGHTWRATLPGQVVRAQTAEAVPGEVLTVRISKRWRMSGSTRYDGEVLERTLDLAAYGLQPLRLVDFGPWDPHDSGWLGDGPPDDRWAEAILAAGVRPSFELEEARIEPPLGESAEDYDPIIEAVEHRLAGRPAVARTLLNDTLAKDLRCIDAHVSLGNLVFDRQPQRALAHYRAGVAVAELSLPADFDGVLSWGAIENRGFLRALHGLGLSQWRLGRPADAQAVFERIYRLNPNDNQGVRFLLHDLAAGRTWAEAARS